MPRPSALTTEKSATKSTARHSRNPIELELVVELELDFYHAG
jgi:hypothetical protein